MTSDADIPREDRPTQPPAGERPSIHDENKQRREALASFVSELKGELLQGQEDLIATVAERVAHRAAIQFGREIYEYEKRREHADDERARQIHEKLAGFGNELRMTRVEMQAQGVRITSMESRLDVGNERFILLTESDGRITTRLEELSRKVAQLSTDVQARNGDIGSGKDVE